MTIWFVTRHSGAAAWADRRGIAVDRHVIHLDEAAIAPGDIVIGTLPVHLAAAVCERGGTYWHLALDLPPEMRGRDLTAAEMEAASARLEPYHVERTQ